VYIPLIIFIKQNQLPLSNVGYISSMTQKNIPGNTISFNIYLP